VRLAGNGARQQGLAGTGRSHQQDAFGNAAAEIGVLLGCLQEVDDLAQFFSGFVDTRYVAEGDCHVAFGVDLHAAAAKRGCSLRLPGLAQGEVPVEHQQGQWHQPHQGAPSSAGDLAGGRDVMFFEFRDKPGILDSDRGDAFIGLLEGAANALLVDRHRRPCPRGRAA
jgi:hypothetical protein